MACVGLPYDRRSQGIVDEILEEASARTIRVALGVMEPGVGRDHLTHDDPALPEFEFDDSVVIARLLRGCLVPRLLSAG